MLGRLRQQGGAMVLTVPNAIVTQMGWQVGNSVNIEMQGDSVILSAPKRQPKGSKSLKQLLAGIDSQEIAALNAEMADWNDEPQGKEIW
ncbi:AbrB/MazE/SpoVT family DNA-binding domain-containing protein [Caviibacterium pharyngocola]|uniref:Antitoxin n=1 Tax=Caviibacterium pharyngocola TaxID=28159 RepID=A0A2M8RYR5_9PAST|nr:antitoxin [Caviibacterium pharyngocola]PJG84028.1 antitoxin [Caviibacterium pharyngocola]